VTTTKSLLLIQKFPSKIKVKPGKRKQRKRKNKSSVWPSFHHKRPYLNVHKLIKLKGDNFLASQGKWGLLFF